MSEQQSVVEQIIETAQAFALAVGNEDEFKALMEQAGIESVEGQNDRDVVHAALTRYFEQSVEERDAPKRLAILEEFGESLFEQPDLKDAAAVKAHAAKHQKYAESIKALSSGERYSFESIVEALKFAQ